AALGVGSSRMAAAAAAAAAASKGKGKGKAKKKKKAYSSSEESDSYDDASKDPSSGLNRSSARKGGKMKDCSVCGRRFLMRTEPKAGERLLCVNCRRSVDKTQGEAASVAKRARAVAVAALPKRRRLKKTADGLLELEPGLPTLQDLCVQAIAKHVDQVESFGDLSAASLDKLCRIVCKMRVLDEHTLALFLGADRGALVLYDCTRLASDALKRIVEMAPNVRTLALEYCGRLDDGVLGTFGPGLEHLASVRLEGAFLVSDVAWAVFLRECGPRLRSFHVRFAGFGAKAMRALVTHCEALEDLRVSECTDFDDACLAMLAPPLTETEEELQEHERLVRDGGALPVAAWRPLSRVNCLDVGRPHLPMTSSTALRVVATLGPILQVLDLSGFRDIDDDFLRRGLEPHCSSSSSLGLRELGLAECNGISAAALA
ncbi:UV-damaged DNA-binding protein rad7, partial [Coemansia aciculifera]